MATLAAIQDEIADLTDVGVICVGLLAAGYYGRKAESLRSAALSALLAWVSQNERERERLAFLHEDIDTESITLRQTEFLVSFLTDTAETLAASPEISAWINDITGTGEETADDASLLAEALANLALTKQKHLTNEAIDAAFRSVVNLSTLSKELATWRERAGPEGEPTVPPDKTVVTTPPTAAETRPVKRYELFVSGTPFDAYYGDMGATCLSDSPQHVGDRGFLTIRLADRRRDEIVGMAAMQYVPRTVRSVTVHGFWFAFAFNPVRAVTNGLGETERLNLYLKFRSVVAHVASASNRAVFLPGITVYGLVSNDTSFGDMIVEYERTHGGKMVADAHGFALQYPQNAYARAVMMRV